MKRGGTVLVGPLSITGQKFTSNPLSSGILTVCSILQNSGVDARQAILDFDLEGMLEDQVISCAVKSILECEPDVAGFSTTCGFYALTLLITRELKNADRFIRIILGGPHASSLWKETLTACPWIDFIVVGEGELSVPSIWSSLDDPDRLTEQSGLAWRHKGKPRLNKPAPLVEDLDSLPRINWDFPTAGVLKKVKRLEIEAGRGCPFNCVFCSTSSYWGRLFRIKSPSRLISDIEAANEATGIIRFSLVHDLITTSRKWVTEFCCELRAAEVSCRWTCSARLDTLDRELMEQMAGAGCRGIFIGLESGSGKIQKFINKSWELTKALEIVQIATELNMSLSLSFIMGFPEESQQDLMETVRAAILCKRAGGSTIDVIYHTLAPFPGSPLYDSKHYKIDWDRFGSFTMEFFTFPTPACTAFNIRNPELCTTAYHYRNTEIARLLVLSMNLILTNLFRCPATLMTLDLLYGDDLPEKLYNYAHLVRPEVVGNIVALGKLALEMEKLISKLLGKDAKRVPWCIDLYKYESARLCAQVLPDWKAKRGLFQDLEYDVRIIQAILLKERTLPGKDQSPGEYCVWCYSTHAGFRRALLPRSLSNQLKPGKE